MYIVYTLSDKDISEFSNIVLMTVMTQTLYSITLCCAVAGGQMVIMHSMSILYMHKLKKETQKTSRIKAQCFTVLYGSNIYEQEACMNVDMHYISPLLFL